MTAIYNEIDPFAAQWLRNLISAGHIAQGVVDERSISDLEPADVAGPGQRHFFAGIGGWSYALRLAGVPDDADIWTGSCPCQPFSQAGARRGVDDPRHLWPAWFALIKKCRPAIVFGEQVAGPDGLAWVDDVLADLEGCGYACGASVVSAGGVSAPHGRHRLYFVAYADRESSHVLASERQPGRELGRSSSAGTVANGNGIGPQERDRGRKSSGAQRRRSESQRGSRLGDADGFASGQKRGAVPRAQAQDESVRCGVDGSRPASAQLDPWRDCEWIECLDGKRRAIPTEPALFPLVDGVPHRVGLLRGSGNAIVPQVAATFIAASLDAIAEVSP